MRPALDLQSRAAELLASAVDVADDGMVVSIALPLFRQAVELALSCGLDLAALLGTQEWPANMLLSAASPTEEVFRREIDLWDTWWTEQEFSTPRRLSLAAEQRYIIARAVALLGGA